MINNFLIKIERHIKDVSLYKNLNEDIVIFGQKRGKKFKENKQDILKEDFIVLNKHLDKFLSKQKKEVKSVLNLKFDIVKCVVLLKNERVKAYVNNVFLNKNVLNRHFVKKINVITFYGYRKLSDYVQFLEYSK